MLPLKSILFGVALLFVLAFACPDIAAGGQAMNDGDVRKAEKILSKLRLLHEAAAAEDAGAYRGLASKMFPDLFVKVAELRPGDLSTDLSTSVFLAEQLGRNWAAAGDSATDCRNERPDIYRPLCLELRSGTVRQLLLAKSRLHARWAEALVREHHGAADADTTRAINEMAAARMNDDLIAARVLETLKSLEGRLPLSATRQTDVRWSNAASDGSGGDFADALDEAGALLDWMPRSKTFYQLSNARLAYADGLSWYRKVRETKRLVVSAANAFMPDPLKELRLDAEQVSATVRANWNTAFKQTRLAEQSLSSATPSK